MGMSWWVSVGVVGLGLGAFTSWAWLRQGYPAAAVMGAGVLALLLLCIVRDLRARNEQDRREREEAKERFLGHYAVRGYARRVDEEELER